MRKRRQTRFVQGCDQHAAGNPDAFTDVIVLRFAVLGDTAFPLREYDD